MIRPVSVSCFGFWVFRTSVWVLFGLFKAPFIDFDIHSIREEEKEGEEKGCQSIFSSLCEREKEEEEELLLEKAKA